MKYGRDLMRSGDPLCHSLRCPHLKDADPMKSTIQNHFCLGDFCFLVWSKSLMNRIRLSITRTKLINTDPCFGSFRTKFTLCVPELIHEICVNCRYLMGSHGILPTHMWRLLNWFRWYWNPWRIPSHDATKYCNKNSKTYEFWWFNIFHHRNSIIK